MGLISIILVLMAGVGFLTFGFTESVCSPPGATFKAGKISNNSIVIHGIDYDFSGFRHPPTGKTFNGKTNPLTTGHWNLAGNDASFLFQKVNQQCLNIITKAPTSSITGKGNLLDWYFPCNIYSEFGHPFVNLTGYEAPTNCHLTTGARNMLKALKSQGPVVFSWDQVKDQNLNLAVYES